MPHRRTSSSNSLTELFGSGLTLGAQTIGAGVQTIGAGVNVTMSTISTVAQKPIQSMSHHHHQPSNAGISTELCMPEFKDFLCFTLTKEVNNAEDLQPLYDCLEAEALLQDELYDMELGLHSVLKSNPTLPSKVVGQVHTFLGMVYLELNNNTAAVDAFTRAIWFISRNPEDKLTIAQANHRLGLAYGRKKDYQQAMELLDRAIQAYEPASGDYVTAQEDRHEFMEAQQLELLAKAGRLTNAVACPDAQNKRTSRRRRIQDRKPQMQKQNSFNRGLTSALKAINPVAAFQRQSTTPASLSRENSDTSLSSLKGNVRRQSTCPMP